MAFLVVIIGTPLFYVLFDKRSLFDLQLQTTLDSLLLLMSFCLAISINSGLVSSKILCRK